MAGWCFVLVAGSGVVNAALRLGSWSALASAYGLLVIGKTLALGLLGRRRLCCTAGHPRAGWPTRRGCSLGWPRSRSPSWVRRWGWRWPCPGPLPPSAETDIDPIAAAARLSAPPPLTVARYFTVFYPETLWLAIAAVMAGLYAAGVVRLRRRGDRWPLQRMVFWAAGCAL